MWHTLSMTVEPHKNAIYCISNGKSLFESDNFKSLGSRFYDLGAAVSSRGKKILVFSDVHCRIKETDALIKKYKPDFSICLGDWFDNFNVRVHKQVAAFDYLLSFLNGGNLNLIGNHELNYLFDNKDNKCSGYDINFDVSLYCRTQDKNFIIDKSRWFLFLDGILLTHAGLDRTYFEIELEINKLAQYLHSNSFEAFKSLKIDGSGYHWFYSNRGIVWSRPPFRYTFNNVDQIFGHTPNSENPSAFDYPIGHEEHYLKKCKIPNQLGKKFSSLSSLNLCIDTFSQFGLLFEDGFVQTVSL